MTGARWAGGVALALAIAGCSGAASPADTGPGAGGAGNPPTGTPCVASIAVDPAMPVAGPAAVLHASAVLTGGVGPLAYTWHVQFDGAPIGTYHMSDGGSAIDLPVPDAGIYALAVDVSSCGSASAVVNVESPGAQVQSMRLQIVAPLAAAVPPAELFHDVLGGADRDLGVIPVSPGRSSQVLVLGPTGGAAAYLQFSPSAAPDAIVEAFSDASGTAAVQLVPGPPYSVLVVPSSDRLAPRRIASWQTSQVVEVDAGVTVSGSVVRPGIPGPADAPLAGATVRLVSDGVPSTVAVTAADGSFALHVAPGTSVTVEVTPPDGSGLPRLSATSNGFDLGAPVQVRYAANLGLVDLGGAVVQRTGGPAAGAGVTVVGSLATAGMVTAGASVIGSGQVRIAATADGAGVLPPTLVPAGALSAVIEVAPGDLAVTPLDTTGGAPATLDAPPMQLITTALTAMIDGQVEGLPGALIDLVPTGALAMAAAPMLRLTMGKDGTTGPRLPAGGHYELRMRDLLGRGAPMVIADRAITAIASSYLLPAAIRLQGVLLRDGTVALPGASVQLMCSRCSGLDATLPLTEAASDGAGRFTLAVPDPGTR
ncbi:MAG TPA: hypothetical protein VHW23_20535 [Kofleriaceae bacterium]|nr:hypothetical protein [Kofleriaceae bacterium]